MVWFEGGGSTVERGAANGRRVVYSVYAHDGSEEKGHAWGYEASEEDIVKGDVLNIDRSLSQAMSIEA